jgi:hypothetical protein
MPGTIPSGLTSLEVGNNGWDHAEMHGATLEVWENVKAHGAVGNGTTDDTAAIQAAIDSATSPRVYLPPGLYKITSSLILKPRMSLVGAGPSSTAILTFQGSSPALSMTYSGTNGDLYIGGFALGWDIARTGTLPTGSGHGIYITGPGGGANVVTIDQVWFNVTQSTTGVTSWALYNENILETLVRRCKAIDLVGGGFYFKGNSNMSVVENCYIQGGGSSGFGNDTLGGILNQAAKLSITGTVMEAGDGAYALRCDSAAGTIQSSAELYGCWFEDNEGYNVIVDRGCSVELFGCNMTNSGSGAYLGNASMLAATTPNHSWLNFHGGFVAGGGKLFVANSAAQPVHLQFDGTYNNSAIDTAGVTDTANYFLHQQGDIAGKLNIAGELEVNGALNHDGTTVGFFGVTPAVRPTTYSATNVVTDRAYDANATTTDELADVLGTLIDDLRTMGLVT